MGLAEMLFRIDLFAVVGFGICLDYGFGRAANREDPRDARDFACWFRRPQSASRFMRAKTGEAL